MKRALNYLQNNFKMPVHSGFHTGRPYTVVEQMASGGGKTIKTETCISFLELIYVMLCLHWTFASWIVLLLGAAPQICQPRSYISRDFENE